ncbi:MAG: hypothetical protein Q4G61_00925 [Tissierellia bacterium]|nr:hypothetical protein [Tissierellia bacterium]
MFSEITETKRVTTEKLIIVLAAAGLLILIASIEALVNARMVIAELGPLDSTHEASFDALISTVLMNYFQTIGIPILLSLITYSFNRSFGLNGLIRLVAIILLILNAAIIFLRIGESGWINLAYLVLHGIMLWVYLSPGPKNPDEMGG